MSLNFLRKGNKQSDHLDYDGSTITSARGDFPRNSNQMSRSVGSRSNREENSFVSINSRQLPNPVNTHNPHNNPRPKNYEPNRQVPYQQYEESVSPSVRSERNNVGNMSYPSQAMAPMPPRNATPDHFPLYQVDFTVVNCGQRIITSKRKIQWRFGFTNRAALEAGRVGTACRGREHEVTILWSVTSGKRIILFDSQQIHQTTQREGTLHYSWKVGEYVIRVKCHASPALTKTPGFRQYDLTVNRQSFFQMPKLHQIGFLVSGGPPVQRFVPVQEPMTYGNPPPGPPQDREHDIRRKIQDRMERSRAAHATTTANTRRTEPQPTRPPPQPLQKPPPVQSYPQELVPANVYPLPEPEDDLTQKMTNVNISENQRNPQPGALVPRKVDYVDYDPNVNTSENQRNPQPGALVPRKVDYVDYDPNVNTSENQCNPQPGALVPKKVDYVDYNPEQQDSNTEQRKQPPQINQNALQFQGAPPAQQLWEQSSKNTASSVRHVEVHHVKHVIINQYDPNSYTGPPNAPTNPQHPSTQMLPPEAYGSDGQVIIEEVS